MEDDQPLDLSLPKKTISFFDDIKALVPPSSKKNIRATNLENLGRVTDANKGKVDASTSNPLLAVTNSFHTNPLENDVSSSTEGHCVYSSDDDNYSIVSLDTPSLSGIDDELSMDEEVEEILAQTIKNSPKMISPIKDLPKKRRRQLNKYQEGEQANSKSSATESNDIAEFCYSAERPKFGRSSSSETAESNPENPEHSNLNLNEPLENIVGMTTKIDTIEPLIPQKTAYKSTIDFKNLEKLTVNVGDLNSTRIVSLPDVNPTAMVTHSQPALRAAPVPCNEEVHKVGVQQTLPLLQPSPLTIKSEPVVQLKPIDSIQAYQGNSNIPNGRPDYSLSPDKKRRYISATMKLFESPCINFLGNKPCIKPTSCPYCHKLPIVDKIFEKMNTYPDDKIHFTYTSFISKNLATFLKYFPMICYLFGIRKMSEVLVSTVNHCNKYERYDFYKFIFGGLLFCGISETETLKAMADSVDLDDVCEESVAALIEIGKNPINPFLK